MKAGKGGKEIAIVILVVAGLAAALAAPLGPDNVKTMGSERMQPRQGAEVPAQAGNVTELNINATSVTKSWQGYFGNITGRVTLMDANNKSMYRWDLVNPQGEIYASPSQISSWTSIKCFNYSAYAPEINLTSLEESLNIATTDVDGVNETFRYDFTGSFYVGAKPIDGSSSCKAAYTYRDDQAQTEDFVEVLLTDSTNIIYTTIIETNLQGFDSRQHDFQMIVGEDGHNGDTVPTMYYFYVELE